MFKFLQKLFKKPQKLGLLPLSPDARDFEISLLGGWFGSYEPKHKEHDLPLLSVRTQKFNTCTFNSGTVAKEPDEGVLLSVRFAVIMANQLGLIKGDGFADLRAVEIVKQKYGICEARLLGEGAEDITWEEYVNPKVLTAEMMNNAAKHKSKSFWKVSTVDDLIKLLDEGRTVRLGSVWKNTFNMKDGFKFPWILDFSRGQNVGGHAYLGKGYKLEYYNNETIRCRNSYGQGYGEGGDFYIKKDDLQKWMTTYGAYTDLDMPKEIGEFLRDNANKPIKVANNGNVWKIENGKKRLYPDMTTFWADGFLAEDIQEIDTELIAMIPDGENMTFAEGNNIKQVKAMAQVVSQILNGKDEIEKQRTIDDLKNKFAELF